MKRRISKKLAKRPRRAVADFEREEGPLSADERTDLADPEWITQDEEDVILALRRRTDGPPPTFDQFLVHMGLKSVRIHGRVRFVKLGRRRRESTNPAV